MKAPFYIKIGLIAIIMLIAVPIISYIDWLILVPHVTQYCGKLPSDYYLVASIIESLVFLGGIFFGYCITKTGFLE